ncbi:hypothetical protein [Reinekea sp. G2M2-21]|uniref:hypothetical protein n=1 Tax=Reinekea sp. G2M2-21 TaxID=2788942 RepID=UPI0018AA5479|nr:hypothetical protein [Reinekea sp. G2M2-21]
MSTKAFIYLVHDYQFDRDLNDCLENSGLTPVDVTAFWQENDVMAILLAMVTAASLANQEQTNVLPVFKYRDEALQLFEFYNRYANGGSDWAYNAAVSNEATIAKKFLALKRQAKSKVLQFGFDEEALKAAEDFDTYQVLFQNESVRNLTARCLRNDYLGNALNRELISGFKPRVDKQAAKV